MAGRSDLSKADALFDEFGGSLARYVARLTGDGDEADDVVQEVYLRFLARPPANDANLRAWLFTVATNLVRDRARERHRELLQRQDEQLPSTTRAETRVELADARRELTALLAPLGQRDRTILLMRSEGFPHREIAEAVGTTTRSVGTMIARALRTIRKHIAGTRRREEHDDHA